MRSLQLMLLLMIVVGCGCSTVSKMIAPSNMRNWEPDQALVPTAEFYDQQVVVRNVRNCRYFDPDTFVVHYEDRKYNLDHITGVDFMVAPFADMPRLAHTMMSFEFTPPDGPQEHMAVSIEIRKELGETYAIWKGSARQYELMYVVADERDVVELRTNHRGEDVYLYRTTATPEQARAMFVDVMARANKLAAEPEFYDTVFNNCTTNLVKHINKIEDQRLKYGYKILLPGYSDLLAYEEGLIEHHGSFKETKARAYVNLRALSVADRQEFSQAIRR